MREESHLDDMRAAIRGDFARLAERRGKHELKVAAEGGEPTPKSDPAPGAEGPDPSLQETVASDQRDPHPRRSWLRRLFSS